MSFIFSIYNELSEREIKKTVSFSIAPKIITRTQKIFDLNAANYKTLLKEIEDTNKCRHPMLWDWKEDFVKISILY